MNIEKEFNTIVRITIMAEKPNKKYLLPTEDDVKILNKCNELERYDLSKDDEELVKFIKTQLEKDWRTPLLKKLDSLLEKYKK